MTQFRFLCYQLQTCLQSEPCKKVRYLGTDNSHLGALEKIYTEVQCTCPTPGTACPSSSDYQRSREYTRTNPVSYPPRRTLISVMSNSIPRRYTRTQDNTIYPQDFINHPNRGVSEDKQRLLQRFCCIDGIVLMRPSSWYGMVKTLSDEHGGIPHKLWRKLPKNDFKSGNLKSNARSYSI